MSFFSPWALIWLGTIPVLLWLWRMASTRRQTIVSSLVPFERLLKRPPRRRSHLVVNLLFWLQLVSLIGLSVALAQPMVTGHRAKTVLAILDTSASMGAHLHPVPGVQGPSAFEEAKRAMMRRITHKGSAEAVLLMTTAPVTTLTPQPTSDGVVLAQALESLQVNPLGGNLATTARIGQALLGAEPDETFIVTDEPSPSEPLGEHVHLTSVGRPLPNVAIVGVDTRGAFCAPSDTHVTVTLHNFSDSSSTVMVKATQQGRLLAQQQEELAPRARSAMSLALPQETNGGIELSLTSAKDALAADNRAWVELRRHATLPIMVHSHRPALTQTLSRWLGACEALTWRADSAPETGPYLLITDRETEVTSASTATMLFLPPSDAHLVLSHWVMSADHPISAYLTSLELVLASLNRSPGIVASGRPVISGLLDGMKVPIVIADERDGRRVVSLLLDPSASEDSTPVLLAFFNSLRWLMGAGDVVNVLDPLESDTMDRVSTWRAPPPSSHSASASPPTHHPLAHLLMLMILVLLLVEWWLYSAKRQSLRAGGWPAPAIARGGSGSPEPSTQSGFRRK